MTSEWNIVRRYLNSVARSKDYCHHVTRVTEISINYLQHIVGNKSKLNNDKYPISFLIFSANLSD